MPVDGLEVWGEGHSSLAVELIPQKIVYMELCVRRFPRGEDIGETKEIWGGCTWDTKGRFIRV